MIYPYIKVENMIEEKIKKNPEPFSHENPNFIHLYAIKSILGMNDFMKVNDSLIKFDAVILFLCKENNHSFKQFIETDLN